MEAVARLEARLVGLAGWRRLCVAALFGILATLALPPFHLVILLPVAFVGLFWLIGGATNWRQAFSIGWCFGFAHFVAGLYWFAHALLTEAEKFAWLIPFAISIIPAALAVYPGLVALFLRRIGTRHWTGVALFAAAWTVAEWLRGQLFTGFPWNWIGYAWSFSDSLSQIASVAGALGLGLVTVLAVTLPATREPRAIAVGVALLLGVQGFGAWRLAAASPSEAGLPIRIVQPNIPQHHKWRESLREAHLKKHMDLTLRPGIEGRRLVLWPEAAVPYFLVDDSDLTRALGGLVPAEAILVTGVPRMERSQGAMRLWNSVQVIGSTGRILATYDKHHLVPFGEYLPLRWLLAPLGLTKIAHGMMDFSEGPGPQRLQLSDSPTFSPLVCYEAIFPGEATRSGERPDFLLVVTNDAWFGISSGPYQHFAMTRFRAVEQGLPLLRAANTGISAVVDAHGRVLGQIDLGGEGVLDRALPSPLPATFFANYGDAVPLGLALGLAAFSFWRRRANLVI